MGEVYRARDVRPSRDVALKVLHADVASDSARVRRFEQEAKAASALNHRNILAAYDTGENEGSRPSTSRSGASMEGRCGSRVPHRGNAPTDPQGGPLRARARGGRGPGWTGIHGPGPLRQMLVRRGSGWTEVRARAKGAPEETELPAADLSFLSDLADDGSRVLGTDIGKGSGPNYRR